MHEVLYAGQRLTTTTMVAEALLAYASHLASNGTTDVVTVPIVYDGTSTVSTLLIGDGMPIGILRASDHEARLVGADDAYLEIQARLMAGQATTRE